MEIFLSLAAVLPLQKKPRVICHSLANKQNLDLTGFNLGLCLPEGFNNRGEMNVPANALLCSSTDLICLESSGCPSGLSWHGQRAGGCPASSAVALMWNWFDPKFPVEAAEMFFISSAGDQTLRAAVPACFLQSCCARQGLCPQMLGLKAATQCCLPLLNSQPGFVLSAPTVGHSSELGKMLREARNVFS